ncbi:DUF3068 domain-containing protein [Corynebacterium sp.]|jgi:hypothetical protein|uniref:DUF3068 domain-containing protein n=1 Tax=Corynebacterium sp. TaxID=1720 RepID=UPI0025BF0220|nr:DUF3068 domain-containing protein [Corynebacterium sp.]
MLPKSRILSVLALGLGCILLGVGLILPRLVDADRPVPLDLGDTQLTVSDPEATIGKAYLATAGENDPDVITGPVSRNVAVTLGDPADDNEAAATVGVTTMRDDMAESLGDQVGLLDAEVWTMRVDRFSGAATGDVKVADTLGTPAGEATVDGQWLKFPHHTEQSEYPFFDTLLRRALPASFDRAEEIDGHEVYVFRQEMDAEPVMEGNPNHIRLTQNVTTAGEDGEPGTSTVSTLHRSGTREIAVEPSSGMIVSVREDLHDYYAADDGTETGLLLDLHGETPEEERGALLSQAVEVGEDRPVRTWSLVCVVIGAIVTVAAGVVALRPQRKGRKG